MAKKTWKDIIVDRDFYGDDMPLAGKDKNGNDVSYTLGDLRGWHQEYGDEILRSLEPEREKLARDRQEVEQARQEVLRLYKEGPATTQAAEGQRVTKAAVVEQFNLDENDPLVGQLVRQMNKDRTEAQGKLDALSQSMTQHNNILATVLKTYINRSTQEQFNNLKSNIDALPEKSRARYTYDILKKHAEVNRLNDPDGLPDLNRAFKDLAGEELYAARLARDKQEWEKDFQQKQRMTSARETQAGHLAGDRLPKAQIDVMHTKDPLGKALSMAQQDDELWNTLLTPSGTTGTT